jgi:hypothetical protein
MWAYSLQKTDSLDCTVALQFPDESLKFLRETEDNLTQVKISYHILHDTARCAPSIQGVLLKCIYTALYNKYIGRI